MEHILVVEDDQNISKLIRYNLEKSGYRCAIALTGEEALDILDREGIALIILDIMLPKMDGFEICKRLKTDPQLAQVPIIMLTARGEEVDRVVGLELGADDYIVKPFSVRELVLRVRNLLKRARGKTEETSKAIYQLGNLVVDIPRHRVTVKGEIAELTSMEFKLLVTLLRRKGRVQTREQLLNNVWDIHADVTTRTVDTHIKCLRQKLGSSGELIETVRGYGYRLKDEDDVED